MVKVGRVLAAALLALIGTTGAATRTGAATATATEAARAGTPTAVRAESAASQVPDPRTGTRVAAPTGTPPPLPRPPIRNLQPHIVGGQHQRLPHSNR
ncbi:hypothetical protein ACWEKM_33265, partial [Streptomyces sp. NPDC004752]